MKNSPSQQTDLQKIFINSYQLIFVTLLTTIKDFTESRLIDLHFSKVV